MAPLVRRLIRIASVAIGVLALLVSAGVAYVLLAWDRPVNRPVVAMTAPRDAAHIARGEHLYQRSLLCWTCHGSRGSRSPGEPQAGGHEFDMANIGPGFGYVYGSNLTPDRETGIGAWSDGELVRAIREGITRNGRVIFPVMAYQFYHGLSDDDALAVVAYLRSLPPVRNAVPPRRLSFAAKALQAIGMIQAEAAITQPISAPRQEATARYGEYVAWRMSGCAECHTPRNPRTGRLDLARPLAGGLFAFPEEGFTTTGSNLTPDLASGIGRWTEDQFITAVQTGVRPNGTVMLPFMPWPSYAQWSRDDLHAVWLYLRSLKPVPHPVPASTLAASTMTSGRARGEAIYGAYCLACHGDRGGGTPFTSVRLVDASAELDAEALTSFIVEGVPGTMMPGFGRTLTREQIADLVAFIRASFPRTTNDQDQ